MGGRPTHDWAKFIFNALQPCLNVTWATATKSHSFQCRANGRSLRKAQWKLIHTEISHHAPKEKRRGGVKSYRKAPTRGARQKEQSVERRRRREKDRKGRAHIVHRTHCPPPPLERVTIAFLLSSFLLCHPSLSLSPSHHYSLQLWVGTVEKADHQCGS